MRDLSKEALALLDSARRADSAPIDARRRARQRLVSAVAAGTVSTSALIAKGASLSALGAATGTTTTVAASASFAATLVGAVVTGLSLGLVALAPASAGPERPAVATQAVRAAPAATAPMAATPLRNRAAAIASSAPPELEPPEVTARPVNSTAALRARTPQGTLEASRIDGPVNVGAAATDVAPSVVDPVPVASAPLDGSVSQQPSKASIARETDLLAQVQRALQQGRPATALAKLNQYAAEFPAGMLHEESMASRIVALCAFGRQKDAERWSAEFFRRYPNSPLSARVRGACRAAAQAESSGRDRSQ